MIRMYLILIPYLFPYTTLFRSSDTNGTVANFNVTFLDVASITLTPAGTQQRTAVYDYKDVVYEGTYSLDRKSTRLNSSHVAISYAVFCLKKKYHNLSNL